MENVIVYRIKNYLSISALAVLIFLMLSIVIPMTTYGSTWLGGGIEEPLIKFYGWADSALWIGTGASGPAIIGIDRLSEGSRTAVQILATSIGLIIAIGVCIKLLSMTENFEPVKVMLILFVGLLTFTVIAGVIDIIV